MHLVRLPVDARPRRVLVAIGVYWLALAVPVGAKLAMAPPAVLSRSQRVIVASAPEPVERLPAVLSRSQRVWVVVVVVVVMVLVVVVRVAVCPGRLVPVWVLWCQTCPLAMPLWHPCSSLLARNPGSQPLPPSPVMEVV